MKWEYEAVPLIKLFFLQFKNSCDTKAPPPTSRAFAIVRDDAKSVSITAFRALLIVCPE